MIYALIAAPSFLAKGKHKEGWRERCGVLPNSVQERLRGKRVLWLHAVSVGEVRLACRLIEQVRPVLQNEGSERTEILLTTTTTSGKRVAQDTLGALGNVVYFPFDWSPALNRFLTTVKPSVTVLFETEIWPNLLFKLKQQGIPALIVNGRISDKAFRRYRLIASVFKRTMNRITLCLAQSEEHRQRFIRLGLSAEKVHVTGNMKFDLECPSPSRQIQAALEKFRQDSNTVVLLGASTHSGEEEILLEVYQQLRQEASGLRLVLAPRHLERLAEVESIIRSKGFSALRLSILMDGSVNGSAALSGQDALAGPILVIDKWGVLNQTYACADLIYVGGSLVPIGGHNLAEAAIAGKPVFHGPRMNNFRDMEEEFSHRGARILVDDAASLKHQVLKLIQHPQDRIDLGKKAKQVVLENRGATEKNIKEILECFSN